MRQRSILIALLLAAPAARAATVEVSAFNFGFSPEVVNIEVGDTVLWTGLAFGAHNVAADDGSFRSGNPGTVDTFSHTFSSPGTFSYVCEPHEGLGMTGVINVSPGGGGGQAGTLRLASTAASVAEGDTVSLQVRRTGGDDGPVSVSWSVTAGTAQAADFAAASGTLSWADGDDNPKTIMVHTLEDAAVEGAETVQVTLSNPAGGAALDNAARIATVTIQDDDTVTPGPCVESSTTLCLNDGRFQVEVDWRTGTSQGPGTAIALPFAPDSGLFYFFSPANIEMLVKVLSACVPTLGEKYWVFYAATTNVEFTLTVTDTRTGAVKVYFNPENNAALPIQDTGAFSTCP